ncbi:type II secretion system protein GspC [Thalassomonas viridans]|uniref:Type II secretion system protein GspC n=1 Tax=Thalassomonas viridans TaxID=137584 RepID=A0AAF0CA93_9GAMM|nr:type II secretion system protein GspC [Thalassomonas viridans]WDE05624.1 type II secretion system protein GspC [Thalassomonas viridans]
MELPNNLASLNETIAKLPQQRIAQVVIILMLAYIAYLGAQITWMLVPEPAANTTVPRMPGGNAASQEQKTISVSKIQALNLFGEYNSEAVQEEVIEIEDAPETRLNLTLTGVVASSNSNNAAAIIEHQSSQETYGIGDLITGTRATLEQVHNDRVLIKQSGRLETLMLDGFDYEQGKGGKTRTFRAKPVTGKNKPARTKQTNRAKEKRKGATTSAKRVDQRNNRQLTKSVSSLRNDITEDPGKITDYLKISPKRENGSVTGYRLMPGKNPEFFQTSGLKSGDVAVQMNGFDLTVPSDAAQALRALKQEREVALLIDRNGEMTEILFRIDN